jgi:hypothetical protein
MRLPKDLIGETQHMLNCLEQERRGRFATLRPEIEYMPWQGTPLVCHLSQDRGKRRQRTHPSKA